jgi:hypothetical protein
MPEETMYCEADLLSPWPEARVLRNERELEGRKRMVTMGQSPTAYKTISMILEFEKSSLTDVIESQRVSRLYVPASSLDLHGRRGTSPCLRPTPV